MSALVRSVLAAAQALFAVAALGAAYDPHDVLISGAPQSVGATFALCAVACGASAFILAFGDVGG